MDNKINALKEQLAKTEALKQGMIAGSTTVFNFYIPKGPKGDTGSRWYSGFNEPNASTGESDTRGAARPGDMYLQLDETQHDAKTYIKLENGNWSIPLATVAGIEGKPATISMGYVSTGEPGSKVIIENVGSASDVVLNITIPRGDQGKNYINDGSVDLNVKSISSDNGKLVTDGSGNISLTGNSDAICLIPYGSNLIEGKTSYSGPYFYGYTNKGGDDTKRFVTQNCDSLLRYWVIPANNVNSAQVDFKITWNALGSKLYQYFKTGSSGVNWTYAVSIQRFMTVI